MFVIVKLSMFKSSTNWFLAATLTIEMISNAYPAENTPGGLSLLTVTETDRDSGKNGEVRYALEMLEPNDTSVNYFEVSQGIVCRMEDFDYTSNRLQVQGIQCSRIKSHGPIIQNICNSIRGD